jgi:hypothetical protein
MMDSSDQGCEETQFKLIMVEEEPVQNVRFLTVAENVSKPGFCHAVETGRAICLIGLTVLLGLTVLQVPQVIGHLEVLCPPPQSLQEADEKWTKTLRNLTSEIGFVKEGLASLRREGVPVFASAAKVRFHPHARLTCDTFTSLGHFLALVLVTEISIPVISLASA